MPTGISSARAKYGSSAGSLGESPTSWDRRILLVLAITLHNIPEGLAIGVSFGAAAAGIEQASLGAAIALAIGIGLQNAPEGTAISLPLRADGMSRGRAWWYGQLSAAVEPVAAVTGAAGVLLMRPILPTPSPSPPAP